MRFLKELSLKCFRFSPPPKPVYPARSQNITRILAFFSAKIVGVALLFVTSSNGFAEVREPLGHDQRKILFLGTRFQNDHEVQEPTTEAEQNRIQAIEQILRSQLESTGKFLFMPVSVEMRSKIHEGQPVGECGGCEIDYGATTGADISSWIVVQKVSNLILNINLYMVDVRARKILLTQSVDIRGNTDTSWSRGMNYLIKNHVIHDGIVNKN
jgi:hypothetical protein